VQQQGGGDWTSLLGPGEPYTPNSEKDTSCLGPAEPYAPSTHISELIVLAHIGKKREPGEPYTPNSEEDTSCLGPAEPYAPPTSKCAHISKKREPKGRPTTLAGPGSHLDMRAVTGMSTMPKGHNTCTWLRLSSTELCSKSCLGDFCKVHLVQLRKGSRTKPCRSCGVGVTNRQQLCCPCGYKDEWRRATKTTQREFARLAAIELPI